MSTRRGAPTRRTPARWRDTCAVEERISLVTLGVADIDRARGFYEALGWSGESPDGEVVLFQAGCMSWPSGVATNSPRTVSSRTPEVGGGVTLAYNVASPEDVDTVLAEAEAAGATVGRPGAETFWGGYSGVFIDLDGHPGGRPQSGLDPRGGRLGSASLSPSLNGS
jgi:catechol 2,3-dioxygenase-like lactoylglutathione lyase family enzyme